MEGDEADVEDVVNSTMLLAVEPYDGGGGEELFHVTHCTGILQPTTATDGMQHCRLFAAAIGRGEEKKRQNELFVSSILYLVSDETREKPLA